MATVAQDIAGAVRRGLSVLPGTIQDEVELSPFTTFQIGGPAAVVYRPDGPAALVEAIRWARAEGVPWRVHGGGSNVLYSDAGFAGLLIAVGGLGRLMVDEHAVWAMGGVPLGKLVKLGMTWLAGIPGTVGGAVAMNAGTQYGTVGSAVRWVKALDRDGRLYELGQDACGFAYRDSLFRRLRWTVMEVGLDLVPGPPVDRVLAERAARQPVGVPSAGCVFRNPTDAPCAGWLIDRAGMKGVRVGDAVVSPVHANFICNLGRATAADVLGLIERTRTRVREVHGVWLDLELDVVRPG